MGKVFLKVKKELKNGPAHYTDDNQHCSPLATSTQGELKVLYKHRIETKIVRQGTSSRKELGITIRMKTQVRVYIAVPQPQCLMAAIQCSKCLKMRENGWRGCVVKMMAAVDSKIPSRSELIRGI